MTVRVLHVISGTSYSCPPSGPLDRPHQRPGASLAVAVGAVEVQKRAETSFRRWKDRRYVAIKPLTPFVCADLWLRRGTLNPGRARLRSSRLTLSVKLHDKPWTKRTSFQKGYGRPCRRCTRKPRSSPMNKTRDNEPAEHATCDLTAGCYR